MFGWCDLMVFLFFLSVFFLLLQSCAYCPFHAQQARGRCHTFVAFGGPNVSASQYLYVRDDLKQSWPTSFGQNQELFFPRKTAIVYVRVVCAKHFLSSFSFEVVFFIRMAKSKINHPITHAGTAYVIEIWWIAFVSTFCLDKTPMSGIDFDYYHSSN